MADNEKKNENIEKNEIIKTDKNKEKEKKENEKNAKRVETAKTPKRSPIRWLKDARSEFKKVTWPTPKQVVNNTSKVLVILTIAGLALWGLDSIMERVFKLILVGN